MSKLIPVLFSTLLLASNVEAGESSGQIELVKFFTTSWTSYSNNDAGLAIFTLKDASPAISNACAFGSPRIAISADHPLYQSVISTVLAAKMSAKEVRVNYLDTCTVNQSSWDFGFIELM